VDTGHRSSYKIVFDGATQMSMPPAPRADWISCGPELHAAGERHFFNRAVQFSTTVIGSCAVSPSGGVKIRKRWPSAVPA
jgi:hypothetical protein